MTGTAVAFHDVSKAFRVWHEKNDSLKSRILRRGRGRFTEFPALSQVSFEVPRGTTFALVGANGAGKSTALKLIARILSPDGGTVEVTGKVSALLELGAGFHPDLTGRENIFLNGSILGLSRRTLSERFDQIVEFAGLAAFIDNQVKTYSSGMWARLGFAVAVNVEPDVLLLDEVFAVGDAAFQRRCAEKIAELRASGRTTVIVSHDLGLVQQLCTCAAWIDHGHLRALGEPREVLEDYERSVHPDSIVDERGRVRFGSGSARIGKAELVTVDGDRPRTGEPVVVRLSVDPIETDHRHVVGIEVRRSDGQLASRATTRDVVEISGPVHDGTAVTYAITALPLLPGSYVLHAWLFDDDRQQLLDGTDQLTFEVESHRRSEEGGLVSLGGTWGVER